MRPDPRFPQFVGIPFKEVGRDWASCDCYGLSRLIKKTLWDVDSPLLGFDFDPSDTEQISALIEGHMGDWRRVETPRIGDDILWWAGVGKARRPSHVGTYCGHKLFIHVPDPDGSAGFSEIKRIGDMLWPESKVYGYFRFKGLEDIDTCKVVG